MAILAANHRMNQKIYAAARRKFLVMLFRSSGEARIVFRFGFIASM